MMKSIPLKRFWAPLLIIHVVLIIMLLTKTLEYSYWVFLFGFFYAYKNGGKASGEDYENIFATMDLETRVRIKKAEEVYLDKNDLDYFNRRYKRKAN